MTSKRVLDDIAADLGTPVRVEVREADESTFTDIVTPERPRAAAWSSPRARRRPRSARWPAMASCPTRRWRSRVVVAHQVASADGTARLRLPPALLEAHPGLVVFMGKTSGTVMVSGGAA